MSFRLAAFADEADPYLEGQIEAMMENGISLLEIRGVDGENILDIPKKKAREIRARMDQAGLGVWSIGSPCGKIAVTAPFEPHLEKFRRGLELAHILGAAHFRLFSFYIPEGEVPETYRDTVLERLRRFADCAAGSGLCLCHENEKGIYGDTADRCVEIHEAVPELRAVFDPANFIQCGQAIRPAWEKLNAHVEYLHIKDALPDGTVVPAGRGCGELPYLLESYTGRVLTLEPHLTVFSGLSGLEREAEKSKVGAYAYSTSREAFRTAVQALKALLP